MRFITEQELRERFASGIPACYDTPPDAGLTPAARQYLMDLRIYRVGSVSAPRKDASSSSVSTPATRPDAAKPEYMTSLNSREMVCKDHPRIALRGKLDSLESAILVLMVTAPASFRPLLADALSLVRQALAADVKDAPLPSWMLGGMGEEEVHRASHHPEEYGFPGHILPAPEHGFLAVQLNQLRSATREAELAAVVAYRDGNRFLHGDILLALNRLSSYFYVLQLRAAHE